jgi:hypothetical protein
VVEAMCEDNVVLACQQRELVLRDVLVVQTELWSGIGTQQQRKERRRRTVEGSDRHDGIGLLDELIDGVSGASQCTLHISRRTGERTARRGENHPPAVAFGQRYGDRPLQQPELL